MEADERSTEEAGMAHPQLLSVYDNLQQCQTGQDCRQGPVRMTEVQRGGQSRGLHGSRPASQGCCIRPSSLRDGPRQTLQGFGLALEQPLHCCRKCLDIQVLNDSATPGVWRKTADMQHIQKPL